MGGVSEADPVHPMPSAQSVRKLPRDGVLAQLLPTPRVFAFMALLLVGGMSLGAKEVARWQYLNDTFDSALGLGLIAAVTALSVAVCGVVVGRLVDGRDPRPFVLLAMSIAGLSNLSIGIVMSTGSLPIPVVVLSAVLDGAGLGIGAVALLKVQAAFVQPGAEGAVEILNILRLGIGGVVGALLAGMSPSPATTLIAGGVIVLITNIGLWWAMGPVTPRTGERVADRVLGLVPYLRRSPVLTSIIAIDLALAFVIPTQLVNLVLFDLDVPDLAARSIAAGMVGVLLGRLALTAVGFRGDPRVLVRGCVIALAALQGLGAVALVDGWLMRQVLALPLIIVLGSVCSTYAQGLTAAIVQQEVDEEMRGRVGSLLVAGRNILISAGAIVGSLLAVAVGSQDLLLVLAGGLVLVALGSRGFAAIPRR